MIKKIVFALLIFQVGIISAQKVRKYSNEFLNLGLGAPGMSMSNSRVAGVQDLYSTYYNPAGLAHIKDAFQVGYMHSEYFAGIAKIDYFGIAVPIDTNKRSLAFSFYRFGIDDIPSTLFLFDSDGNINYDKITRFSNAEYAFNLSYGQKLKNNHWSLGTNVKIIHKKVGPYATAWGFGLDGGVQFRKNGWRWGLMARDFSSTYNAWSFSFTQDEAAVLQATGNLVPKNSVEITMPLFVSGFSYLVNVKDKFYIEPELNVFANTDGRRNVLFRTDPISFDAALGVEMNYKQIVYLRTGIGNFQWISQYNDKDKLSVQPNIGVGLNIKGFHIDYTYTNIGDQTSGGGQQNVFYSNVISAHFGLQKLPKKNSNKEE